MRIELGRDWSEFLKALISHRVKFLLIGGHAVAAHAEPRLTEDLDVFVEATDQNGERLRAALVDFGFGAIAPPAAELTSRVSLDARPQKRAHVSGGKVVGVVPRHASARTPNRRFAPTSPVNGEVKGVAPTKRASTLPGKGRAGGSGFTLSRSAARRLRRTSVSDCRAPTGSAD